MADGPISLDQFRKKKADKEADQKNKPLAGTLVWLNCPTCERIEYTEVVAPSGRTHSCGTQVEEKEVLLDLRGELTLAQANLARLEELLAEAGKNRLMKLLSRSMEKTLSQVKASEETYIERLQKAGDYQVTPYEGVIEEMTDRLPIAEKNPLGLWISKFRQHPERRFEPDELA